ncbi:MAG: hypothetical protein KIT87_06275 [Anaerolineae bacterium]|nr:hypothetical protein [Anaerolineae bacterium]
MLPPYVRLRLRWLLAALLLAPLLVIAAAANTSNAAQADCVTMSLDPLNSTVAPNQVFTVNVRLSSPNQAFLGADFDLRFDPAVLQVVTSGGVAATTVDQGDYGGIAPVNQADNTAGRVRYAEVRTTGSVTGNFTLASIRFKAIGPAGSSSALTVTSANAATPTAPTSVLCGLPANGLVTIPTPTPTPTLGADTPTPTRTVTPTRTASPTASLCPNILRNSGFEDNTAWQHPITPRTADYTSAEHFAGSRAMRLGIEPPGSDVYSYSTAYQQVSIPSNATRATLVFYYKPFTEEAEWTAKADEDWSWYDPAAVIAGRANKAEDMNTPAWATARDWQEALILDYYYRPLATVFRSASNAVQWRRVEYDLTRYKNQTINVYFNALNNGTGGRRTWMYLDEVYIYICTDPQPATPTPTATTPPVGGCFERILNGGFESNAVWQNPITPFKADYTTATAHSGARSMRVGVPPGNTDRYSHSSAYQSVVIPWDAQSARLTFWFKPFTEEPERAKVGEDWKDYDPGRVIRGEALDGRADKTTAGDYQEALILDRNYRVLRTIFRTESNFGQWAQITVDLTAYRGMRVVPYFNAFNDGDGRRSWMFVDDVSLEVCYPGGSSEAVTVSGSVSLQGRSVYNDTIVGVDEMPCDQTGPTGTFQCEVAQDEPNAARLTADHPGYLRADKTLGSDVVAAGASTELVAGDVNDDCAIDIFDLVRVAAAYDTQPASDEQADLNGDGEINIYDLVLTATNYGLSCPTPWTGPMAKVGPVEAKGSALVSLRNDKASKTGGLVWAEVVVEGQAVYGADVRLSFDPTRLAPAADKAELGAFLQGAHVALNQVDAKAGTVRFAATLLNPAPAANGRGVLIRVPFRVIDGVTSKRAPTVHLDRIDLVQRGGLPITVGQ